MKDRLVSAIVPVYNRKDYLPICMESLLHQTYSNLEIILVDDGSRDGSGDLCDKYATDNENVSVIHKTNGGLMSAWITGVGHSRGQYLFFVDSDDWVEETMIETLAEPLDGLSLEISCCGYVIEKEKNAKRVDHVAPPGVYEREKLAELKKHLVGEEHRPVILSRCMKLITRDLVLLNMHYCRTQIRMGEDVNIMLPAILDCDRLILIPERYDYHYRVVGDSMVHGYDAGMCDNLKLLHQAMTDVLTNKAGRQLALSPEEGAKMADREYRMLLFLVIKNEIRGNRKGARKQLKQIFRDPQMAELISQTPVLVSGRLNRMMYKVQARPGFFRIGILKFLFGMQALLKA